MPEVLIYGPMYQYSAENFITKMNEAGDNDITARINCEGGSPEYGFGMVAKFGEHKGKKNIKVDGMAHSMALYFLCYADDSEALDVSQFTLHRAAYSEWLEKSDYMTSAMWEGLDFINKKLRAALEAKIDVTKFESLKGVTLNDVFSNDKRIDVKLTAKEAKQICLINRIHTITPAKKAEISNIFNSISSEYNDMRIAALGTPEDAPKPTPENTNIKMDLNKIKADYPALYAEIIALGVAQEKDRVGAWMAFNAIDPEAVKKGIESGANISQTAMAEFSMKALSAEGLKKIAAGNPPPVTTDENAAGKPTANVTLDAFEAETNKHLKINPKA